MRAQVEDELVQLLSAVGWSSSPFWKLWAKLEILLGLAAVGAGMMSGSYLMLNYRDVEVWMWTGPVILFACGGYLALAGHRSHLYQSNNRLAAYLATVLRDTGNRHEHSG